MGYASSGETWWFVVALTPSLAPFENLTFLDGFDEARSTVAECLWRCGILRALSWVSVMVCGSRVAEDEDRVRIGNKERENRQEMTEGCIVF